MKTDIIVVGAGMAGVLIAYFLQEKGKKVIVLEAEDVASGQTGRTTAKITSQHGIKYSNLIKTVGKKKAMLYAQANEAAIDEYERLIKKYNIDCDFQRVPSYLYSQECVTPLIKEAEAAKALGIDSGFVRDIELPFSVKGGVCFKNQAMFDGVKFVNYISKKLDIKRNTKVIKIRGNKVITDKGVFLGNKIVVATHYPIKNIPGFYFMRQHQERSYVMELSGCPKIKGMYYGIDKNGLSFRQWGENLVIGGGSHRTGHNVSGGSYCFLKKKAVEIFPDSHEVKRWSAQDAMPHDGIPFIGRYSIFTPDIFVATGFQKWGMTSAMVTAMILRDEVCDVKNPYSKVFTPQRMNIRAGMGKLLLDIYENVKGLIKGYFGKSHRCSHMGCALTWNPDEKTWDCPCHGSRFDSHGNLIDNPAGTNIKI